jgi:hypothetical protein
LEEFEQNEVDILDISEMGKRLIPFKMRAQKLVYPNNKCISIVNYKKGNVSASSYFSIQFIQFIIFKSFKLIKTSSVKLKRIFKEQNGKF